MPNSIVQILFRSKCEVEIKIGRGYRRERERDREREVKQRGHHHVDSNGVPLVLFFWSSWWWGSRVVLLEVPLCTPQVPGIQGEVSTAWAGMGVSSDFCSHSGNFCPDANQTFTSMRPGISSFLLCCLHFSKVLLWQLILWGECFKTCNIIIQVLTAWYNAFPANPCKSSECLLPFRRINPYILAFDNLMNQLQWKTFFLIDHVKISPCDIWNKII